MKLLFHLFISLIESTFVLLYKNLKTKLSLFVEDFFAAVNFSKLCTLFRSVYIENSANSGV